MYRNRQVKLKGTLMRRLIVITSGSIALLLLIAAGDTVRQVTEILKKRGNQVVLLNHAKEAISQGEVHVFGQTYRFERLAVGETAEIKISARGEGQYVVDVLFQSGRKLSSDELGYLTGAYGVMTSDLVEIQDDKIILLERKVE